MIIANVYCAKTHMEKKAKTECKSSSSETSKSKRATAGNDNRGLILGVKTSQLTSRQNNSTIAGFVQGFR